MSQWNTAVHDGNSPLKSFQEIGMEQWKQLTKVKDIINDRVPSPMIVSYLSNTSTLPSNLVNPLFPFFLFFNTENRSRSTLRALLFTSLHKFNSNFLALDCSIPYCRVVTSHNVFVGNANLYQKQVERYELLNRKLISILILLRNLFYALYVDFDFELAQKKLVQVETVLKSDFFLASLADEFVECARHLIS